MTECAECGRTQENGATIEPTDDGPLCLVCRDKRDETQPQPMTDTTTTTTTDDSTAFEAIVDAGPLMAWIDTLTPIVDEARVHLKPNDWLASAVDPANVAMIRPCRLNADAFESYTASGGLIGLNLHAFEDRISAADTGQLVHLSLNEATRKLDIEFGSVRHTLSLIDPEAIRKEPENPDLDLPNSVTLTGTQLDNVVTNIDLASDHVFIRASPDEKGVRFVGQGDTDDTTVEFGPDDLLDGRVTEETEAVFSLDYVEELVSPIPKDADVQLTFGDEFPMLLDWKAEDGTLHVHQMLAPRIQSN